jgi:hypothetical protein
MRGRILELDADHDVHIHEVDKEDIQIVADHCQALRSAGMTGNKDDKYVMTADSFTIMNWCNKWGIPYHKFWSDNDIVDKFLDDPDNKVFRIWEGKV